MQKKTFDVRVASPHTRRGANQGTRPERSAKAIAERRELYRASLADSALEDCYPDAETLAISERWVKGEITSEEELELLKAHVRALNERAAEGHGR